MTLERFLELNDEFNQQKREKFIEKNKEYASEGDIYAALKEGEKFSIHEAENAADIAWSYATKHLVSIIDIIKNYRGYTKEQIDEKFGDFELYLELIRAFYIERK